MSRTPEFDEVVGGEVAGEERARLRAAHDLLAQAAPPPELEPWLELPPAPWLPDFARREKRPQGRRWGALLAAAAVAGVAFLLGTVAGGGGGGGGLQTAFKVSMHGTRAAAGAQALLDVGERDAAGNWPMLLSATGLKPLPAGGYYELFLTRGGKLGLSCGTFRVTSNATSVRLNAPYALKRFNGWVVVRHLAGEKRHEVLLTT